MAKVYNFVGKFGSAGSGDGQFSPSNGFGIAVDANYIYVADTGNNRIQIFNRTTFAFIGKFGVFGSGDGQFSSAHDVAVDATYIYVADKDNNRIQIFNKTTFAFIGKFTTNTVPHGIEVDDNYILVRALQASIVIETRQKISPYLTIHEFYTGAAYYLPAFLNVNINNLYVPTQADFKTYLRSNDSLINTIGGGLYRVGAVDNNYIYTILNADHKVKVYDINTYALVEFFGSLGAGDGQFNNPVDIAIYNDTFYVADASNNRIQIFNFTYQTAPAAPSGLTAACGANRTIVLNWTDNS